MRFGVFYEHQLPRPWEPDSEYQLIQDALEQVEFADKLGIEYCWEVEHHFLEEYSHSSAPEVFLAAASQRTRDIRLGHGIVQTAPAYNHPARTAERIATLDLVSGGRVEFGSGESSSTAELAGFGIDPVQKREMWREGLEVAVRCLTEEPFGGVDGKYIKMPPRNVVPKPRQKPHPPLWLACSRHETIRLAAQHGLGALTFAFVDPEEARRWTADYEKTLADACVPIGQTVTSELACVTSMMVHRDEREAIGRGLEGGNFFGYSLGHYYIFGDHVPAQTDVWQEFQRRRKEHGYSPETAVALEQKRLAARLQGEGDKAPGLRGAVGTPDQVRDFLRRYEDAGVDQLIFIMQAGRTRHEHIMEALQLFGRDILPEFKDRDVRQRAEKVRRLEPAVAASLRRKEEAQRDGGGPTKMPSDYVIEPLARSLIKAAAGEDALERIAAGTATGDDTLRGLIEN